MPRKTTRKTTTRKTARKSAPKRRPRRKKQTMPAWQWGILALSFICLLGSVYLTFFHDQADEKEIPSTSWEPSITEKARELAQEHPEAEVFNLDTTEKKK